jgi:hypothetical protein
MGHDVIGMEQYVAEGATNKVSPETYFLGSYAECSAR